MTSQAVREDMHPHGRLWAAQGRIGYLIRSPPDEET